MSAVSAAQVELIPMRDSHIDEMLAIERAVYRFPWTRGNFADSMAAGDGAWGCRVDGELAGYCILMIAVDEAHLLNISVARRCQRRGLGSALLAHSVRSARLGGASSLLLEVRRSNEPALTLYHAFGFRQIGVRKDYYPAEDGREDALVLCLTPLQEAQ